MAELRRAPIFREPAPDAPPALDLSGLDDEPTPRPSEDALRAVAARNGFPAREPAPVNPTLPPYPAATEQPAARPQQRRHRTGRDRQLNLKVDEQTRQRFLKIVDDHGLVQGHAFALAVEALERELTKRR